MARTSRRDGRGFTLIELLMVLVISALLLAVAAPSWRAFQRDGVIQEARLVLTRLDLKQRAYWQRYGRYAGVGDLPPLGSLSSRVAGHYTLQVELSPDGFQLLLSSDDLNWPSLGVNHLGFWSGSEQEAQASGP